MTEKIQGIWPKAKLTNSDTGDLAYQYDVSINPFLNYLADSYNDRDEMDMVNGYFEHENLIRDNVYTLSDGTPIDSIKNFTGIFFPEQDRTKRYGFKENVFNNRSTRGQGRARNVFLLDHEIVNCETSFFRSPSGTDEISGYFPAAVKIKFSSNAPVDRSSLLGNLLGNLGVDPSWTGLLPYFVKNLIDRGFLDQSYDDPVYSLNDFLNQLNWYSNFINAYDSPVTSCCPLSRNGRPTNGLLPVWTKTQFINQLKGIFDVATMVDDQDLFFEIVKKDENGSIVQKFYTSFLTLNASSFEFYDTQVKVGKFYSYEFYSFRHYPSLDGNQYGQIMRSPIPIFSREIMITQPSLPVPDVSFSSEKDEVNKYKISILLNMNKNSENGTFVNNNFVEFIPMSMNISNFYESLVSWNTRKNMLDIMDSKPSFVYESQVGRYEIFRMTSHPTVGYENITVEPIFEEAVSGTQLVYIDTLEPFKKYYYVFRAINFYDYPSNPTPIYEVELIEDADEVFLNMKVVNFLDETQKKYKNFKSMMKYLQIIPSSNQTTFDEANLLNVEIDDSEPITVQVDSQMYKAVGYITSDGSYYITGYYDGEYNVDTVNYLDGPEEDKNPEKSQPLFTTPTGQVLGLSEYENSSAIPSLGLSNVKKIWHVVDENDSTLEVGEKFKIRLVSNDTGRKLDLNIRFKLKKN